MEYAMSPGGLMVHSRNDWPCACCRPHDVADSRGFCLCVKCARTLMRAAEAGVDGIRALLDDLAEALTALQSEVLMPGLAVN
jgi:hypothetical protein